MAAMTRLATQAWRDGPRDMTERLADVSARIDGIRQLGAVVNAMKGIAAARARTARAQIAAIDSYAATVAAAMSSALGPADADVTARGRPHGRGSRSAGVLRRTGLRRRLQRTRSGQHRDGPGADNLFLIGTRGLSIAAARGLHPIWSAPMSSHTPGHSETGRPHCARRSTAPWARAFREYGCDPCRLGVRATGGRAAGSRCRPTCRTCRRPRRHAR
jgi:hypothetical protein